MNELRHKMEAVADEFAQGVINRAQFNAVYKRYAEQRSIIERLLERNPESEAWRQVISAQGHTNVLRTQYEAQPLYFLIYAHGKREPIMSGGENPKDAEIIPVLKRVWEQTNKPKAGLGRKQLERGYWLILATGEYTATAVVFSQEPAITQAKLVRDLHADFERANQSVMARGWIVQERMVFPQRSLFEDQL
jgi:hypothetical protein